MVKIVYVKIDVSFTIHLKVGYFELRLCVYSECVCMVGSYK
jgi:hypothetical protein